MTLRLNESGDLVRLEPVKVAQFMGHSHDAKLLATAAARGGDRLACGW